MGLLRSFEAGWDGFGCSKSPFIMPLNVMGLLRSFDADEDGGRDWTGVDCEAFWEALMISLAVLQ
jgi:hypothetical protein